MKRYVAFLRGMNLGKRRIKNPELCAAFAKLGFEDVSAFLASGNVMFRTSTKSRAKLEAAIAGGLQSSLNYEVPTFVRDASEVIAIANATPFSDRELATSAGKIQVAILAKPPPAPARKAVLAEATDEDRLVVDGCELYWLPQAGLSTSALDMKVVAKALGPMTVRTQRTLIRLQTKLDG